MMQSKIPKPTSGHLGRVTCWCPEVGLGIPNLTSGHFGSCRETWNFLDLGLDVLGTLLECSRLGLEAR